MTRPITHTEISGKPLLNLGCGRRYHPAWTNLDLEAAAPEVLAHDLTQGLPFGDNTFDAVYHSHVLEHFSPEQGQALIAECVRVLRPGGVLRIVVPDLEQIAQLYLEAHREAWKHPDRTHPDYHWLKLELLDQMVRQRSGGRMGAYMARESIQNEAFVRSRIGDEFLHCQQGAGTPTESPGWTRRWSLAWRGFRLRMARRLVRWTLGHSAQVALDEGLFRQQGEIHRWMYDRYSLRQLCLEAGMSDFEVCDCLTSAIPNYAAYQLDAVDGQVRKPDSLFVECRKPATNPAGDLRGKEQNCYIGAGA